jgi:hypothetical protein
LRIPVKYFYAFLAFLLAFGCIYAVNLWHQQLLVEEPLAGALGRIEGVKDVELNNNRKEAEVWITLGEVDNLPQIYGEIEGILLESYEEDSIRIHLLDSRDPYLESVYHKVHFALLEAERLGNYSAMSEEIFKQLAQEKELKNYRLWIDQKRIYLSLATSRGALYKVIPVNGERAEKG